MLNLLLGPVVDIVSTSVKGFVDTKKAKAEQKVTEIKASLDAQIAEKITPTSVTKTIG